MGQQPSKPTNTPSKAQAQFDEKRTAIRSSAQLPSEDKLAAYSRSSEGSAGLALDKLEAWQHEFDNVSLKRLSILGRRNS